MEEKDILINTLVQKPQELEKKLYNFDFEENEEVPELERTFFNPSVKLTCEQGRIEDSCENKTFEKY